MRRNKTCASCVRFRPYYTKLPASFEKTKYGLCLLSKTAAQAGDSCGHWAENTKEQAKIDGAGVAEAENDVHKLMEFYGED